MCLILFCIVGFGPALRGGGDRIAPDNELRKLIFLLSDEGNAKPEENLLECLGMNLEGVFSTGRNFDHTSLVRGKDLLLPGWVNLFDRLPLLADRHQRHELIFAVIRQGNRVSALVRNGPSSCRSEHLVELGIALRDRLGWFVAVGSLVAPHEKQENEWCKVPHNGSNVSGPRFLGRTVSILITSGRDIRDLWIRLRLQSLIFQGSLQ